MLLSTILYHYIFSNKLLQINVAITHISALKSTLGLKTIATKNFNIQTNSMLST